MVYNRKNRVKKYSVIIIPERGSNTKKINLSSVLIKSTAAAFFIVGISAAIFIYIFSNRYNKLNENTTALKNKNEYIKNLEKDNKDKEKQIQSYKVYQKSISHKMEKLNELEKDIKDKLDKSNFLNEAGTLEDMTAKDEAPIALQVSYLEGGQTPIQTIDDQIESLIEINKKLDKLLEKEQYIPSVVPCEGSITSYFGTRDNPFNTGGNENHPAIDVANSYGTKIHATAKGKVLYAEMRNGYGNCVCIDHGNGFTSLYGHASELLVEEGQVVEKGEVVALMGSTGRSTGPHVHFELRKNDTPINPIKIFE